MHHYSLLLVTTARVVQRGLFSNNIIDHLIQPKVCYDAIAMSSINTRTICSTIRFSLIAFDRVASSSLSSSQPIYISRGQSPDWKLPTDLCICRLFNLHTSYDVLFHRIICGKFQIQFQITQSRRLNPRSSVSEATGQTAAAPQLYKSVLVF